MDTLRAMRWAVYYFIGSSIALLIGVVFVVLGWEFWLHSAVNTYLQTGTVNTALRSAIPGIILSLIGFAIWRFGKWLVFYKTLTGAIKEDLTDEFDTEHVKSDIMSLLDSRLSDMQDEIRKSNRNTSQRQSQHDDDFELNP
ncbi:MAG: hypothetical protein ABEI86_07835 [Halobacteriaceae archaeon]